MRFSDDEDAAYLLAQWEVHRQEVDAVWDFTEVAGVKNAKGVSDRRRDFLDAVNKIIERLKTFWPLTVRQIHYQSIKSFTKWLADHHRLKLNPLSMIRKPDPKTDRRHERRILLPDEWRWLTTYLAQSDVVLNGMEAQERLLLYRLAIQTGLRASELTELTRSRLVLDNDAPHVLCKAAGTKNRKQAKQNIDRSLASALAQHVKAKHPLACVFGILANYELAPGLQADRNGARQLWLESLAAGKQVEADASDFLAVTNHDGEHLVFHSHRHTCGAWLAKLGENPKTIQTVMRHGTITLTMDTYGHLFPGQAEAAVNKLATMMAS